MGALGAVAVSTGPAVAWRMTRFLDVVVMTRYPVAVEIADQARKHGISDEDMIHAARNAFAEVPTGLADRIFLIGADSAGRFLEVIVVDPETDPTIIHADVLPPKFYRYV